MLDAALQFPLVKLFNRVLADYPLARERLRAHAGKTVATTVGPLTVKMRISGHGEMELVGEKVGEMTGQSGASDKNAAAPDVALQIAPSLLSRLARGDESAFSEVVFTGDSELAATISMVVRNVKWDIEEDLSRVVGDIAAHRVVGGARALRSWGQDAQSRLMENIAEYLTEERRSFITTRELEELASANETLRDDLARLGARLSSRLNKLTRPA